MLNQSSQNAKKQKTLFFILWFAFACTLCLIWGNSLLTADVSSGISRVIYNFIKAFLPEVDSPAVPIGGHSLLRKLGHWAEFLLLGAISTRLFHVALKKPLSFSLLTGILVAMTDETIQLFVEGRSGEVRDVWIDSLGFAMGTGLILLLRRKSHARAKH